MEPYPEWVQEFRPHQIEAAQQIATAFEDGAQVVILDAPTGSGKTLISEMVRRQLEAKSSLYVCSTKSLQDQFVHDFPSSRVVKGRRNYPTVWTDEATADDCTWTHSSQNCYWCPAKSVCPYEIAKRDALRSSLAVLNTAYALTEWNGPARFAERDFVVLDEADVLEGDLMSYAGLEVGERTVARLGLGEPSRITKPAAWAEWCANAVQKVSHQIPKIDEDSDLRIVRRRKSMVNLLTKIAKVGAGIEDGNWIYTGKHGAVSFKPVRVDEIGRDVLWAHGKRFLLMSATIISAEQVIEDLGGPENWSYVEVGSTFPPENRPVKVIPSADMSRKPGGDEANVEGERNRMVEALVRIAARHPGERILVHAVSYDLSSALYSGLNKAGLNGITYTRAAERDSVLADWLASTDGILVAPSLDRGIDLADDKCRVVVIAKVPFPNLGDRQVGARLHSRNGDVWYRVSTIRTVVQMTGRATRHKDDRSTSYILDQQFMSQVWGRGRRLFPSWWVAAVDWRDRLVDDRRLTGDQRRSP